MTRKQQTRTGAPSKLTPEKQKALCELLSKGHSVKAATAKVGVDRSTYYAWLKRGRRELDRIERCAEQGESTARRPSEANYVRFWLAVDKSVGEAETTNLQIIEDVASGNGELVETTVILDADGNVVKKTAKKKSMRQDWRAARWLLERRFPKRWERRLALSAKDEVVGKFREEIDLSKLNNEELSALEKIVEKAAVAKEPSDA